MSTPPWKFHPENITPFYRQTDLYIPNFYDIRDSVPDYQKKQFIKLNWFSIWAHGSGQHPPNTAKRRPKSPLRHPTLSETTQTQESQHTEVEGTAKTPAPPPDHSY